MDKLQCPHKAKTKKMRFSCQVSGDYELILCDNCRQKEDRNFLIAEENVNTSEEPEEV